MEIIKPSNLSSHVKRRVRVRYRRLKADVQTSIDMLHSTLSSDHDMGTRKSSQELKMDPLLKLHVPAKRKQGTPNHRRLCNVVCEPNIP
ncbi:hypothetical protein ElyMa_006746100 [Elysia marginata]|uniref:Uncharacterized protein n=1 Tax=Elysia marginata TaxID=1093978 RepID=A0AAV4IYB2_9GAST|nr:hypothetical protein ElyMa_006746100 [Elysia marginata]